MTKAKTWHVQLERDRTEYAVAEVEARSDHEAEGIIADRIDAGDEFDELAWRAGNDTEGLSVESVEAAPPESSKSAKKKLFHVYVTDRREVRYAVEATSATAARRAVEASDDADRDFGFKTVDSEWSVEHVEVQS